MPIVNIAVFPVSPALESSAAELAQKLDLPLTLDQSTPYDYLLTVTADYVGVQKNKSLALPLYVDFLSGKTHYRSQHTSLKKEALARAMGLKNKTNPKIVDATGGLAMDAFTLAALGFTVTLLERSSIMYTLVANAIQRAQKDPAVAAIIDRLNLVNADAISWLRHLKPAEKPEIIYLDPMFPQRKKSALPQQKMLILHDIVGEDVDAEELLQVAIACAIKRVVVKRPRLAAALIASPAPSFSILGSSSRFDVYLLNMGVI